MRTRSKRAPLRRQAFVSFMALFFMVVLVSTVWVEYADAKPRGGGRSFSRSKSFTSSPYRNNPTYNTHMNTQRSGSSFMRGLGGGLLGGFMGSMLFGGVGHGMGMGGGGFGGTGIGFLEILIIGGLIYFLYKKFSGKSRARRPSYDTFGGGATSGTRHESPSQPRYRPPDMHPRDIPDMAPADAPMDEVETVRRHDPGFDPEGFKEFAQDVFFKVQAAWTRRDISVMKQHLGHQLLGEYERHFADLKAKGRENRLENIAVRKVDIVDMGEMDGEPFVIVQFHANLLDYTVDEATGEVLDGSATEPIKFEERWAFSKAPGSDQWKLEGIQE